MLKLRHTNKLLNKLINLRLNLDWVSGVGVGGLFGIGVVLRGWVGVGMEVEDVRSPPPEDCLFRAVFRSSLLTPPKIILLFRKKFFNLIKLLFLF